MLMDSDVFLAALRTCTEESHRFEDSQFELGMGHALDRMAVLCCKGFVSAYVSDEGEKPKSGSDMDALRTAISAVVEVTKEIADGLEDGRVSEREAMDRVLDVHEMAISIEAAIRDDWPWDRVANEARALREGRRYRRRAPE